MTAQRSSPTDIQICESTEQLLALAPAWDAVVESSPRPWLYLTHAWMAEWWDLHRKDARKLHVLVAHDGGKPVGIAPLVRHDLGIAPLRFRRLQFMTMESQAFSAKNLSGSLEIIAQKDSDGAIDDLLSHLSGRPDDWDYLRLHPLPAGSETLTHAIAWADRHGFRYAMRHVISNAIVEIPPTWEEFLRRLSPNFRKSIRRIDNMIAKKGGFRVVEAAPDEDPNRLFEQMADIDRRSWKAAGGISLADRQTGEFYRRQVEHAHRRGDLMVFFVEADGQRIAYDLFVRKGSSVENLKGSYDVAFSRWSPGTWIVSHEIKAFQSRGITRFNLLWGDLPYKLKWTDRIEMGYELYISNRTARGSLVHWVYIQTGLCRLLRFMRKLPERLGR